VERLPVGDLGRKNGEEETISFGDCGRRTSQLGDALKADLMSN
jgi:hypothetical protein